MKEVALARLGRPPEFDRDEAIDKAVVVFWEHGYDATSISVLRDAMGGLSSASFYGAFESKEALFKTIIDRYQETMADALAPLTDSSLSPRQAVERALLGSARMQTDKRHPLGCLVAMSLFDGSSQKQSVGRYVASVRAANRKAFRALIKRAVRQGKLEPGPRTSALAAAIDTVLLGIAVQARDGIPFVEVKRAVEGVMALWDLCARMPVRDA